MMSLMAALGLAGCATPPAGPVTVQLLAINDFHGHLEPPPGGFRQSDPAERSQTLSTPAGGAAHLATAVKQAVAAHPHTVFVAAGDLIGASPLISALAQDKPTVDLLSRMGLWASAVGNHEFDRGHRALLDLQRQAGFQWLAASTIETATGRTILPPYLVRRFDGIDVAFIGLTLKDTPSIVAADGVAGLQFRDEAETVNALVPELRAKGIEAIVVLIHEGGFPSAGPNDCPALSGPITQIVPRLDKAVDVVITGHTHRAYNCRIDGRLVTSADRYGTVLSHILLTLDPRTRDVVSAVADNQVVAIQRFAADADMAARVAAYAQAVQPLAQRPVGRLAVALANQSQANGEMPAGRYIADAQLAATRAAGAQIALMNPGGVRAALTPDAQGRLTYGDLFSTQPFYNNLVTMTLSGAELQALLERQWQDQPFPRVLQVSRGFAYRWDASQPAGRRVVPGSLTLDGRAIQPDQLLRITVNSFLAAGGDRFSGFQAGRERLTGAMDLDALQAWVASGAQPDDSVRVTRLN